MMNTKLFAVLCCVLASVLADGKYTDKYDDFDIDTVLGNDRLYESSFACLMDEGKCTPETKELKDHIQDAFDTGCTKCTEAQQKAAVKLIDHTMNKKKAHWERMCAKYDRNGKWREFYEKHKNQ